MVKETGDQTTQLLKQQAKQVINTAKNNVNESLKKKENLIL
jgi:nucleoid DNA-binding protein